MAFDDILAGIGGALEGGLASYSWQKDYQQRDRKITEDAEIRRLQQEIRQQLATMAETGKNARNTENVEGRRTVAVIGADGRERVAHIGADGREIVANLNNATTERGQDINKELGLIRNDTARRGQDFGFTLGGMRDATTRRGQTMSTDTARRGQDFGFTLGTNAETGRNTRAGDANRLREEEAEKNRQLERDKMKQKGSVYDFPIPNPAVTPTPQKPGIIDWLTGRGAKTAPTARPPLTQELVNGTGRPTATPIEVIEPPSTDPPQPRSPEAAGDEIQRLETQARSLLEQGRKEADPARKAALRSQLQRVREQLAAAQRKAGGG